MSDLHTKLSTADDGDTLIVTSTQDCEPALRRATGLRQIGATGSNEMKHAAHFPSVIIEQYLITAGIDFQEFMRNPAHVKRLMSDPDLKGFRVWEGKV